MNHPHKLPISPENCKYGKKQPQDKLCGCLFVKIDW